MSVSVTMPALGESVTEGTVTRWLKAVGDVITADEPLLEVSTDKVDTEIPAPASGVLLEILVPEDGVAEHPVPDVSRVIELPRRAEQPVDAEVVQQAPGPHEVRVDREPGLLHESLGDLAHDDAVRPHRLERRGPGRVPLVQGPDLVGPWNLHPTTLGRDGPGGG